MEDTDSGETSMVLIALIDSIREGDNLCIAEEDSEEECNGAEVVDPRASMAVKDFEEGNVVLSGDEIPDDLPRSLDPTCALVLSEGVAILRALGPIQAGQVFSILPDDDEEYEEVEVDLETGEMIRFDSVGNEWN